MRYPAYPLITLDPYISLWSCSDQLNDDNVRLWHGMEKPIYGILHIDGESLRFMGAPDPDKIVPGRCIAQKSVEMSPLFTKYIFENSRVRLTVSFWSPAIMSDLQLMSTPCSFIDYNIKVLDGRAHSIAFEIYIDGAICGHGGDIAGETLDCEGYSVACFGKKNQRPLHERGDGIDIDWGSFCLAGRFARYAEHSPVYDYSFTQQKDPPQGEARRPLLISPYKLPENFSGEMSAYDVFAYDDGLSLVVLGEALKGVWTERFEDIETAIDYFYKHHDELRALTAAWEGKLLQDAEPFGGDYVKLITAVYRHVLAAHKAVRNHEGELLYMSKECNSNGCINTVDVSYPSMPLMLCYNPELVRGMMTGIFEFALKPCWKYDFAPHDLGQYPIANGQVYAFRADVNAAKPFAWLDIYRQDADMYDFSRQMPVEECGNMILMAYAYMRADGSARARDYIARYMPLLRKWAGYLISKGIDLDMQLCTDDFAGHLGRNVNLAVKSCEALFAMGELTGDERYRDIARRNAAELAELARNANGMMLCLDKPESWSLKYNMAWDSVAGFGLFPTEVKHSEIRCYHEKANEFGVPLDSRRTFAKSDWMLWAAMLDDTDATVQDMAEYLCAFLGNTLDRIPMADWFDTVSARRCWMWHRSVQGGLWMPVLRAKWNEKK